MKKKNMDVSNWSHLPADLLELILTRLNQWDKVRASLVCKTWHSHASSICILNKSLLLLTFPIIGDCFQFFDPTQSKMYSIKFPEFPELKGCNAFYSKDGWLLLCQPNTNQMLFFNPFTREVIELPRFMNTLPDIAGFSCAPTSPGCVLFTLKNYNHTPVNVTISTCYPGATSWTTLIFYNYKIPVPLYDPDRGYGWCSRWNRLVFCNGLFYCLTDSLHIGVFDPNESTWTVLKAPPPKRPFIVFPQTLMSTFMTEQDGKIWVICACSHSGLNPIFYKLDQTLMEWMEMTTLEGVTFFVDFKSSVSKTSLPATIMRNNVYFPCLCDKRFISFSLDDSKFHPRKQLFVWGQGRSPFMNIWIEPPKDFSSF